MLTVESFVIEQNYKGAPKKERKKERVNLISK